MDMRVLFFLLVLATSCCYARVVTTDDDIATALQQINHQQQAREVEAVESLGKQSSFCDLCKKIASPVLSFLSNSTNQKQIQCVLKKICSAAVSLKGKCNHAVNYYLPLLFTQVSILTPKTFCIQIRFCKIIGSASEMLSADSSQSCNDLVSEVLSTLKDPDRQSEAVVLLTNACDAFESTEGFSEKCKSVVPDTAPLILGMVKNFLETYDVCTILQSLPSVEAVCMQTPLQLA